MKQASMARWLKWIIAGVVACGLIVYAWVIPAMGKVIVAAGEGSFDHWYWPWLIFLWGTGLPCLAAMVLAWKIAGNIGADRAFSLENAGLLKGISRLALGDAAYFLCGNLVLLLMDRNHPGIVAFSLLIVFAGVAIGVAAGALSHLVSKAEILQDQSDWTI